MPPRLLRARRFLFLGAAAGEPRSDKRRRPKADGFRIGVTSSQPARAILEESPHASAALPSAEASVSWDAAGEPHSDERHCHKADGLGIGVTSSQPARAILGCVQWIRHKITLAIPCPRNDRP